MNKTLKQQLITLASKHIPATDVSHDLSHALRVLSTAERIAKAEKADLDVVIPAALFHDLIVYPKNHPNRHQSQTESANAAEKLLKKLKTFPQHKIQSVKTCIEECSFSKGIVPKSLESKILQDADGLEATGAIAIMRTYASTGQMQRPFYATQDPFCKKRQPDPSKFALDLFYERLLKVEGRMHTKTAKQMAKHRTAFLKTFLKQFAGELSGN